MPLNLVTLPVTPNASGSATLTGTHISASPNPATNGLVRGAPGDSICLENAALSGNLCLARSLNSTGTDGFSLPLVSAYNGSFTSGQGIPVIDGTQIDSTAQGANISPITLVNAPSGGFAPGFFRISAYIIVTQAATTSSTLPSVVITWNDRESNVAQTFTLTPTNAGNTTTTFQQATMSVSPKAVANINFSTTGYATSGATPMQYSVHVRVEAM